MVAPWVWSVCVNKYALVKKVLARHALPTSEGTDFALQYAAPPPTSSRAALLNARWCAIEKQTAKCEEMPIKLHASRPEVKRGNTDSRSGITDWGHRKETTRTTLAANGRKQRGVQRTVSKIPKMMNRHPCVY